MTDAKCQLFIFLTYVFMLSYDCRMTQLELARCHLKR